MDRDIDVYIQTDKVDRVGVPKTAVRFSRGFIEIFFFRVGAD